MKLKLLKKKVEANGAKSFVFKPEKNIKFLPGQHMYFTLPSLTENNTHLFTISVSPTEGNNIQFTTRIREESEFKQTLNKLSIGEYIEAEGPSGTFIIDEKEKGPHVLIAGGIGITPFRSIIVYHADKKLSTPIHLIYSNKSPDTTVFRQELGKLTKSNDNFNADFIYTNPQTQSKSELNRRIDIKMLNNLIPKTDQAISTFWVCGPPSFVASMQSILKNMKINSKKIRTESFTGY